ncbi:hypothetical protein M0R45_000006 [Rubus argutus]|uniref:Uncharacterized protein n=1 Tax=Rubus argutus TaxID=59490 RepID=A0AAW1VLZ4_RUBAR
MTAMKNWARAVASLARRGDTRTGMRIDGEVSCGGSGSEWARRWQEARTCGGEGSSWAAVSVAGLDGFEQRSSV